ncbi:hypothetical protein PP577_20790 [Mycobacteroides abscessus]|nr:hypothetical protein [Mycobacteroides abscessus]MDM2427114.1 hypothetical protein [Mycobacteroides abscessus]MDM2432219.1 hypothetical protein [Mycobacteroides abscessus]MDM2436736.1 hypothetical protein [Mycobacteroides abscessus]MDM2438654.1 hypothetical protein [Mycobacteroides abscessus]
MFADFDQPRAQASGFAGVTLLDGKITVYHCAGAGIDVIVSRVRQDGAEIARKAPHYELARIDGDWRIVSVQISSDESRFCKAGLDPYTGSTHAS